MSHLDFFHSSRSHHQSAPGDIHDSEPQKAKKDGGRDKRTGYGTMGMYFLVDSNVCLYASTYVVGRNTLSRWYLFISFFPMSLIRIQWDGYSSEDDRYFLHLHPTHTFLIRVPAFSWEPMENFVYGCERLLESFWDHIGTDNLNANHPIGYEVGASQQWISWVFLTMRLSCPILKLFLAARSRENLLYGQFWWDNED